jgi:PLP dependent protein
MNISYQHTADERLQTLENSIVKAAREAKRDRNDIGIIAVSKTFPSDDIRTVLATGQRVFGENRVQEAAGKWPALKQEFADIELHLIGPLQTNKTKQAIELFECIQTLDREKLVRVMADAIQTLGRAPKLMVQVNTGSETQKAGIMPGQVDEFIKMCRKVYDLDISGLMCIPPIDEEPALHFALLEKLAKRNGLQELSMGMSADYEKAIQFGATKIRVGRAIFGERAAK